MSYSRRQLYAMGEPLGDSATWRKADGGLVLGDGGGGGTPEKTTQVADLPEWAKGYAQETLAKGQALTDINQNRYQPYQGQRIADFSPLQQQAFQGASNLQPSQQLGAATGVAGAAAMGALGTSYDPYRMGQFTPGRAAQYMSPYMQNVVDRQKMEAYRASQLLGGQQQAQATQAGAFGGYREGIQRAERERGLRTQLDDIQAKGLQSAFDQAQQNFAREQQMREQSRQYGAGLGMQGLQTALQGAGQLGSLGQQQFGQEKDVLGVQSQFGAQQQAQQQQALSQQYQDFQNQQRYPYQQLEFMSNLLRGTPMGTVSTLYQAPASTLQNLGQLGLGAYGASKMFADGGEVSSYADGGSVTDQDFVASSVRKLSDAQLQSEMQAAAKEGDEEMASMLKAEMARRSSMRGQPGVGLSSLFSEQMADRVLPTEESMARGGIVAFARGGQSDEGSDDDDRADVLSQLVASPGNPRLNSWAASQLPAALQAIAGSKYTPMTGEAYNAAIDARYKLMEKLGGKDPSAEIRQKIEDMRGAGETNLERSKGLAALQAAAAMGQGRGFIQGVGRAGGAFATSYGQALQADQAEKRALANMEINLADAQRKERMGLGREAISAADQARRDHDAAQGFGLRKATAMGNMLTKTLAATKTTGAGSGAPKPPKGFDALAEAEYQGLIATGERPGAETRRLAYRMAADLWGKQAGTERTDVGMAGVTSRLDIKVADAVAKAKFTPEYLEARTQEERDAITTRAAEAVRKEFTTQTGRPGASAAPAAPVNINSTSRAKPSTVQGLPAGAVVQGDKVYDQTGKLIGHVR